jgi:4-hydroxy-tetrahydrodipicolinate reductase
VNPGVFGDRLPVVLTTLSEKVSRITVIENDVGEMVGLSNDMIFNHMGFGWTQAQLDAQEPLLYSGINDRAFIEAGDYISAALGFEIDKFEKKHDFVMAEKSFAAHGRTVEAGTVAAIRNTYSVYENGKERAIWVQAWTLNPNAIKPLWDYGTDFYQIFVEGSPSFKMTWHPDMKHPILAALIGTATAVMNAIPTVCDAEPGIRTTLDLPMVRFSGKLS